MSPRATEQIDLPPRRRVPAAQRREELIEAAVVEFARGGLHGTPVGDVARRVGVAQPYVFSLFANKRELFLAAVETGFARVEDTFRAAAAAYERGEAPAEADGPLKAMGLAYFEMVRTDRVALMLQHQSYAACDDEVVRERVRGLFARLVETARELSGAGDEDLDQFIRQGMACNVAAALGVEDLAPGSAWVDAELARGAA
ncbi:MAG TPA: TetR/AcrR family transcriptional regulator [Solirubrobacteraceae bacterium]|nr:TetR/AcrR family transcriptional regulator [Solirubrobacteraceae bacterium]